MTEFDVKKWRTYLNELDKRPTPSFAYDCLANLLNLILSAVFICGTIAIIGYLIHLGWSWF